MKKHFTLQGDAFNNLELNIEEIFCAVPKLKDYFMRLHEEVEHFENLKWRKDITKQRLCERIESLLSIFVELDIRDLRILFLLKNTRGISYMRLLERCESIFESERLYNNDFLNVGNKKAFNPFSSDFIPLEE